MMWKLFFFKYAWHDRQVPTPGLGTQWVVDGIGKIGTKMTTTYKPYYYYK